MLVLTRKTGETIHIGDNITIHVVSVGANNVKIGIEAPRDVAVNRGEIHNKIQAAAALAPPTDPPSKA